VIFLNFAELKRNSATIEKSEKFLHQLSKSQNSIPKKYFSKSQNLIPKK
jgi:hypothetical protein